MKSALTDYSIFACVIYYAVWVWILPHYGRYRVVHEKVVLDGGEVTHKLVKVPLESLETWDREHDAQGKTVGRNDESDAGSPVEKEFHGELKGIDEKN